MPRLCGRINNYSAMVMVHTPTLTQGNIYSACASSLFSFSSLPKTCYLPFGVLLLPLLLLLPSFRIVSKPRHFHHGQR